MLVNVGKWMTLEVGAKGAGQLVKGLDEAFGIDREEVDSYGAGCVDALESLFLALACAGVDVSSPTFVKALETTLDAIENNV